MRFMQDKRGFSLVEAMIAIVIATIGLAGAGAMQINAMNGTFFANSQASGSGIALAWMEWINGLVSHGDQDKIQYKQTVNGVTTILYYRENFVYFTRLDNDLNDTMAAYHPEHIPPQITPFVEVVLPTTIQNIVDCFNGVKAFTTSAGNTVFLPFRKEGRTPFTAADMPPVAPPGASIVLRIAANVPVANTATIEVALIYANAFVHNRSVRLRLVVASNM